MEKKQKDRLKTTIAIIAFGPLGLSLLGYMIGGLFHCGVNEGSPNPCKVLGIDFGGLLYAMVVVGWISIITAPIGTVILLTMDLIEAIKQRKPNLFSLVFLILIGFYMVMYFFMKFFFPR